MITPALENAHGRAAARLLSARGSIREAFDRLGTSLTFDDLIVYVERDSHAKAAADVADDLDRFHARLVGLVAGCALTIVEADREARLTPVPAHGMEGSVPP